MSMSDRQVDIATDAAALGRSMYQELRASDMRYHGAHLLAEYIVQAGRMFEAAAAVTKDNASLLHDLGAQRELVQNLTTLLRFMSVRTEAILADATASHVNQLSALKQMLDSLAHAQNKLEATRAALDLQQEALREERSKLAAERSELAAERSELAAERSELAAERSKLVAERSKLAAERASFNGLTLWQRIFLRK
jgi:chromosome segregation ATPase